MNRIVKILMERDNMTELQANNFLDEIREELNEAIECGDICWAEDIMIHDLGLEMDYFEDVVGFY